MAKPKYSGHQPMFANQLYQDPVTGEMIDRPGDMAEVGAGTEHARSPLGQMFAPDKTNLGVFASLAALTAGNMPGGGGGVGKDFFQQMASKGIQGQGLGGLGRGAGANIFQNMAKGGGVGKGAGAGVSRGAGVLGPERMSFGEMAGLTGLQAGLGLLGGLFDDDPDRTPTPYEFFEGKGDWVDPVKTKTRNSQSRNMILRALADQSKKTVTGLDGMQSPIQGLDYGPSDIVARLDALLNGGK